jgi:NADPH:quinone reductase-like Zn-dependent oxidoreductase
MSKMPTSMRAAYVEELGPADNIRYGELPVPVVGPTDVLVEVEAVAVDPVDIFVRAGTWRTPTPFPFVIGRDLVGRVTHAGPGAVGFAPGQRVWCNSLGHEGRQGSFSTYASVPADRLYHLPDAADPVEAVSLLHPAATAHLALHRHGELREGETVLVGGAAGNVGTAAVQLAAMAGARVLATCRPADADWCRRAGAAEVLDYADPALGERVRELAPGGVDLYVDTSGRIDLELACDLLAFRGRIVLLAGASARPVLPVWKLFTRDGRIHGFVISRATIDELAGAAAALNRCLATGRLLTRIVEVLPLERAADAHRMVERRVRGRVVLRPSHS